MDKQSIQVTIADRTYPLNIAPNQEEEIRLAVKAINEMFDRYRSSHSNTDADTQDNLSMVLLHFALKLQELGKQENSSEVIEDIRNLEMELENYIRVNLN
ncbi:MAG: cell division protein ZapA [Bacteroidales bacterium]